MQKQNDIHICDCTDLKATVFRAMDAIGAGEILRKQNKILIKPNLVTDAPHPVTTSPEFCEAVLAYVKKTSKAEVIIAEGSGEPSKETLQLFHELGYTRISRDHGVELVDLNVEKTLKRERPECACFPEMRLPSVAFSHFIVSLPVLKAHSLARITGSMKNMMGFAPPAFYSGGSGHWKKAAFHNAMQQSIMDLNKYRTPDLTVMDATVGMAEFHLGGPRCNPPRGKIIAGFDPRAVDRRAADLLELDWREIGHLN